jgi:glycosyltransferase involved in cell wall biosynthesis
MRKDVDFTDKPRPSQLEPVPVTFIGHPYAPIGTGEQLRSHLRACCALGLHHRVFDVFRCAARHDQAHVRLVDPLECTNLPPGIRVFHINGDEVDTVLNALSAQGDVFSDGYNIIVPAWELPVYPTEWANKLKCFDEVWALSSFIKDSLSAAGIKSHWVGQAVEMESMPYLPRRYFSIRESAFVLLNFFDLSSHATRKNPHAVLKLFDCLRHAAPLSDVQLVLKVKDGEKAADEWVRTIEATPHVKIIAEPLDTWRIRSLINACDCFVSLHRSEGFGRGLAEAMFMGKLAMGTGWSGNLDFMTADNSLLVNYELIAVRPGEYPHGQGQVWADPDVDHAAHVLRPILRDPACGRTIASRGQMAVSRTHSNRAVGLRILARLESAAGTIVRTER